MSMAEIDDTGKVWIKGKFSTEFAVRVGDAVIVPGKQEDDKWMAWVSDNALWADLNCSEKKRRILRKFPLDLPATTPATLFNGFTKTKHADVEVITFNDDGVEELILDTDDYTEHNLSELNSQELLAWILKNGKWGER
jgi:hypothetical protein